MLSTLLVYESIYGSTEKIAKNLALIMGPARCCRTDEVKDNYKNFDMIVVGSPVYREKLDNRIINFLEKNLDWLQKKKVVLFCTCLTGQGGERYLQGLKELLGDCVVVTKSISGNLELEKLKEKDYKDIISFFNKFHIQVKDKLGLNMKEVTEFGYELLKARDCLTKKADNNIIKSSIEQFLKSKNTCTLITGANCSFRGTVLEYLYEDRSLYIITEGGKKFCNILVNPEVKACVYNYYKNMGELQGILLSGRAYIIDKESYLYSHVMEKRGLKPEVLGKLPAELNLLRIKLSEAEFLNSNFKKMGCEAKQVYKFIS